jgi:hypothetical protein
MTGEDSEMREYRQGETVRLTVTVRDRSGVHSVNAQAFREGTGPGATPLPTMEDQIYLTGYPMQPGAPTAEVMEVVIQAQVTFQTPGVYECREIRAVDRMMQETIHRLEPPKRFRIVESAEEDREGPEVLEVSEFS